MNLLGIFQGILEQGLIYSIIAMGVYITYHILDFPDLTVDGSFPLGGAIATILITRGVNGFVAIACATLVGAFAGLVTGVIHVKFKVRNLLSGILTMTALYSINMRISGRSNVQLFDQHTIFNGALYTSLEPIFGKFTITSIIFCMAILIKLLLDFYLNTKSGMILRATGDNKQIVTSLAVDSGFSTIVGLMIANAFVALGGAIIVQQQRYYDVSIGTGTIVTCLASVIIGLSIFKNISFVKNTTAVIIGAILYKAVVAISISFGLNANDMKLIMAVTLLIVLVLNNIQSKEGAKC